MHTGSGHTAGRLFLMRMDILHGATAMMKPLRIESAENRLPFLTLNGFIVGNRGPSLSGHSGLQALPEMMLDFFYGRQVF